MFLIRDNYSDLLKKFVDSDTDCQISLVYVGRGSEYYLEVLSLRNGVLFGGVDKDVNQLVYRAVRELVMNAETA